jgi:hypothetical protein
MRSRGRKEKEERRRGKEKGRRTHADPGESDVVRSEETTEHEEEREVARSSLRKGKAVSIGIERKDTDSTMEKRRGRTTTERGKRKERTLVVAAAMTKPISPKARGTARWKQRSPLRSERRLMMMERTAVTR